MFLKCALAITEEQADHSQGRVVAGRDIVVANFVILIIVIFGVGQPQSYQGTEKVRVVGSPKTVRPFPVDGATARSIERSLQMSTVTMPGFTAERSLLGSMSQRVIFSDGECNDAIRFLVADNLTGARTITRRGPTSDFTNNLNGSGRVSAAAEREPGGPGNVPSGYGRDCKRVPYTVCAGNRCWTEYTWECTFYPVSLAQ